MAPMTLPDWLYERIRKPAPTYVPAPSADHDPTTLERRARAYIAKIPPAIAGAGGHAQTFAAARVVAGIVAAGLPESIGFSLLCEYNATCQPPWSERELEHKWMDAKAARNPFVLQDRPPLRPIAGGKSRRNSTPPPPNGPPQPPGDGGDGFEPNWRQELLYTMSRTGRPRLVSHLDNVIRILQLAPEWKGKIRFDEFRSRIVVTGPPWDNYQKPSTDKSYWTDEDTSRLCARLRRDFHGDDFAPSISDCERAVGVVAHTHAYNPLRDYLRSLAWDGQGRLSSWLTTYLGAERTEYTRLVGSWWLISAVARIMTPGCKVDTVPILEGRQGLKKSSALRVLSGAEYFNDTPLDLNSKDAYTAIQGCWFVELAELDSLMRVEATRAKAFFSSSKDKFRAAYARHETEEPRQCIFVGTTNLDDYLNDPTGARRFWPIHCSRVELEALARDRDQLWSEAVHELDEGRLWFPTSEYEDALLGDQQAVRTQHDAWEEAISTWLNRRASNENTFTMNEVLAGALNLEEKDWSRSVQTRVGTLLTARMGYGKRKLSVNGARAWVYGRK
ncbi:MAG: virulence-associated E family protein, partial [Polyangiaceae bacterium]|nr:virulence-associated E family protein [Polyangiaceae bacterium]